SPRNILDNGPDLLDRPPPYWIGGLGQGPPVETVLSTPDSSTSRANPGERRFAAPLHRLWSQNCHHIAPHKECRREPVAICDRFAKTSRSCCPASCLLLDAG